MPSKFSFTAIVASACVLGALTVPAHAGDDEVSFSYKSSDLRTPQSVEKLYGRIESHANRACFDRRVKGLKRQSVCRESLINDYVSSIDDRRLTALHRDGEIDARYARRRD